MTAARCQLFASVFLGLLQTGTAGAQANLVTAVRDGSGNLKVISWGIHGNRVSRLTEGVTVPGVTEISAVRLPIARRLIATAVRNRQGRLEVILWEVGTQVALL